MVGTAGHKTRSALSKRVTVRTGGGFAQRVTTVSRTIQESSKRRMQTFKYRTEQLANLTFEDRDELHALEARALAEGDSNEWEDIEMFPPGEESMLLSHAGGEHELCRDLFEDWENTVHGKRIDARTRRDRTELRNAQWATQIGALAKAYLLWRTEGPPAEVLDTEDDVQWSIKVVDFFSSWQQPMRPTDEHPLINEILARHGFLGSAPIHPSVAITFRVLDAFRQQHRVCPRFSLQAQVRALCYIHSVPFSRTLVHQFSIAFDLYLEILYSIDDDVKTALNRNTPNYRMLNACAPCLHALQDEPPLQFSLLVTMDGNQSLKLVDDKYRGGESLIDSRQRHSDLWIPAEEVDQWKDEVARSRQAPYNPAAPDAQPALQGLDADTEKLEEIDAGESGGGISVCEERWRNAGPESRKKMFALFAITGVFVALCRHGQLLIMCDMIRSGELMKYPLAIIKKLLEVYPPGTKIGYDVACAFFKLLHRSLLAPDVLAKNLTGVVPAFHGHSHNRGCQVHWHPRYMEGVGKEDFEGCERLFSESNALAPGTRLSTPFHRVQAITEFFGFWSEQKHVESAKFIANNYRQALAIIADNTESLALFMREHKVEETVFQQYLQEERAFLEALKTEPAEFTLRMEYMEALQKLEEAGVTARAAQAAVDSLYEVVVCTDPEEAKKRERKVRSIRNTARLAWEKYDKTLDRVAHYEMELGVEVRWVPNSAEYEEARAELVHRQYRRALDRLELLVVQRFWEMDKMGMSGTGYAMREKIGKALRSRAQAVQRALAVYNRCAAALSPPRPTLQWAALSDMVSLAEFDLLRDSRRDIRDLPWARPTHRRAMNLWFDVRRAREEIDRLNLELRRLLTAIMDEHVDYWHAISSRIFTDPSLARELSLRWQYCDRLNTKIVERLYRLSLTPGFTGRLEVGVRVGRSAEERANVPLPSWARSVPRAPVDQHAESDDDEPLVESGMVGVTNDDEASRLVEYLDNVAIE